MGGTLFTPKLIDREPAALAEVVCALVGYR